jgi:hypothetical protein
LLRLIPLVLLVPLAACGSDPDAGGTDGGPTGDVTYYQHVKPIMDAKCARCHQQGGIAPFTLETYDDAAGHAGVSQIAINDGIMPPWLAADDCNDYVGDWSLTEQEKQIINAWVDGGALAGDPADEGAPIELEDVSLSRVDLELSMPVEYSATKTPDDYRCFLIPWPEEYTDTKYVTGFAAVPGNERVVHHIIAFLASPDQVAEYQQMDADEDGPGYTCFGGTGGPAQTWIGSWAPGGGGRDFVDGTGVAIEPGSMIILQVHYNVLFNDPEPDKTAVQFRIADSVDRIGATQPWTNPFWLQGDSMMIPANDAGVSHSWTWDPTGFLTDGEPFQIHGVGFHMHQLGTSGTLRLRRSTGEDECLIKIDRWDFNWQQNYGLRQPVTVNPGDQLYIECNWDNSLENQPVVNGEPQIPRDVTWGEGTTDEMCLSGFYWTAVE